MSHPLSDKEQRCIALLAEAANLYADICREPLREGQEQANREQRFNATLANVRNQADNDWNEACAHFHVLQHALMGQAAARIYPHSYRLLGGIIRE